MRKMLMIDRCIAISILCCYLVFLSANYERMTYGYNSFFSLLDDYKVSDSSDWGFYSKPQYEEMHGHFQFSWTTITIGRRALFTNLMFLIIFNVKYSWFIGFLWGLGNCIHGKSKGWWSIKLGVLLALGVSHTNGLSHPSLSSPQLAGYTSWEAWGFCNEQESWI